MLTPKKPPNPIDAKPRLKDLAQQGNPHAIARLINRSLKPKGISAQVALEKGCLQVMLTSNEVPSLGLVKVIHQGLIRLEVKSIERVKVYGKQVNDDIPDRALFFVPFPALQDAKANYLIEQHTILTAPSIQMLDLSRQKRQQIEQISNNDVLIVGNPKMPSLPPSQQQPPQPLSPLPGAEEEAKAIASLLNAQAMTGESATEPIVLSRMLKARIIHLATHGLLDPIDERQFMPGAIALTSPLEWKPSSEPRVGPNYLDGFLSSEDILGIPLSAELVVLSACDTGLGELTEDGILGLSRAFIMAGVPSLVVSLWSVPDAPTAELMIEFYQNLQQNPDKAQALRQAMLTIKKKYPNPKDWAAFTLIGESN